jgi:hypothetical protein
MESEIRYHVHKSHPLVPFLSQINQYPTGILLPIHATHPAHRNFLRLTILIMLGEQYKLWSSSLCSFVQSPVT